MNAVVYTKRQKLSPADSRSGPAAPFGDLDTLSLAQELRQAVQDSHSRAEALDISVEQQGQVAAGVLQRVLRALDSAQGTSGSAACSVSLSSLLDKWTARLQPGVESARRLVTYAHKLSYTTFAPPGFVAGKTNLRNFRPPAPQDWQLRASLLHQFAAAAKSAPPGETAAAEAAAAAIPPMPPGWKPGDAIPEAALQPLGSQGAGLEAAGAPSWETITAPAAPSAAAAGKAEAPARAAPPPPAPNSAFDFILNPDLEEVEEAYSSDEAYSDDA